MRNCSKVLYMYLWVKKNTWMYQQQKMKTKTIANIYYFIEFTKIYLI